MKKHAPSGKLPDSLRLDVKTEIEVRLEDMGRRVKLFLVDLSENGARFRSGVVLPPQAGLSFIWMGPSREAIVVHGHLADMKMVNKKTAEYEVQFAMPAAVHDRLVYELIEALRRKTVKSAEPVEALPDAMPEALAQAAEGGTHGFSNERKAYRAIVQFPVTIRAEKKGRMIPVRGEARDVSMGGMMLLLHDELEKGTELELEFSLPVDAPATKGEIKEVVEMTPFGERKVKKSTAPAVPHYELIQTRARIMKHVGSARSGSPLYGVSFVDMPPYLNEELARWIHAHQLQQVRSKTALGQQSGTVTSIRHRPSAAAERSDATPRRPSSLRETKGRRHYGSGLRVEYLSLVPALAPRPSQHSSEDAFGRRSPHRVLPEAAEPASKPVRRTRPTGDVFGLGAVSEPYERPPAFDRSAVRPAAARANGCGDVFGLLETPAEA